MRTSLFLLLGLLCLAAAKPHNEGKRNHPPKRAREHKLTNRMEHDHHRREHGPPHKIEVHHGRKVAARRPATPASAAAAAASSAAAQGQHEIKKDLHLQHITEHNIEKKHEDKWVGEATSAGKHHLLTNRVPSGENTHLLTNRTPQVSSSSSISSSPAPSSSASSPTSSSSSTPGAPNNSDNKNNNNTKTKVDGIPMESERLIHVTPRPPKVHKANNNNNNNKPQHRPTSPAVAQPSPPAQPGAQTTKGKAHKLPKKFSPKKHGWKKNLRKEKAKDKVKEKRERREKRNKALHRAMAARQL